VRLGYGNMITIDGVIWAIMHSNKSVVINTKKRIIKRLLQSIDEENKNVVVQK
jgi:hypothetical protein